jgi:hypothetical protein
LDSLRLAAMFDQEPEAAERTDAEVLASSASSSHAIPEPHNSTQHINRSTADSWNALAGFTTPHVFDLSSSDVPLPRFAYRLGQRWSS